MARSTNRLSAAFVKTAPAGMHPDGGGLYLQASVGADQVIRRSWIYRYALAGRERHMGLGSIDDVGLADARQKAADARKLKNSGLDPINTRDASKASAAATAAKAMTFDACRDAFITAHRAGWRNVKHSSQWSNTLDRYVTPTIGKVNVGDIDTGLVMQILEPIWSAKPETASRVRGRVERILDWAKVRGFRDGENPARWRGHLDHLLPAKTKIRKVVHHPAMPYADIPTFIQVLRGQDGIAARALEFAILTAARTGEVIGATVGEINLRDRAWTIPAARMKAEREHRVPLCDRALAIIFELAPLKSDAGIVFPGQGGGKQSNMAMLKLLDRMKLDGVTVHGFRSTFRDWAAERTSFPNEVVEMALAHAVGDKVEAAYRRGDLFDKRRRLMDAWAAFCERAEVSAEVVPLRA